MIILIDLVNAYESARMYFKYPLFFITDADDCYCIGNYLGFVSVDKKTGKVVVENDYFLMNIHHDNLKYIYYDKLYDDFWSFYQSHKTERELATMYACTVYAIHSFEPDFTDTSDVVIIKIRAMLGEIEKQLYCDIREIIDCEVDSFPQCVLDNRDDPYYLIKPFMYRNGWTTGIWNRMWVRV